MDPFVVQWDYPRFVRKDGLDPCRLKSAPGRPLNHTPEKLLEALGEQRLCTREWSRQCATEFGIGRTRFFELLKELEQGGKVQKSRCDQKWEQIRRQSGNYIDEKDQ